MDRKPFVFHVSCLKVKQEILDSHDIYQNRFMRPHLLNNSHIMCITHFLKELQKQTKTSELKNSKQITHQIRSFRIYAAEKMNQTQTDQR